MAQLTVCSVFDSAAQAYARPFFLPHANMARRTFQDEVNRADPQNPVFAHPQDFVLYELGFFDEDTAKFSLHDAPRIISRAQDLKDAQT